MSATGPLRARAATALVTAAATAVHYALPDVVRSRAVRGWAKAGLTAIALTAAAPELRSAWSEARQELGRGDGVPPLEALRALSARRRAIALAPLAAVLACTVAGLVALERRAFRHGQARAAAGKRLPHTGPALLYGALSGVLWLLPPPPVAPEVPARPR